MMTHSVCGALPLAIIITSDETTETLVTAFSQLKSSLPADAFFSATPEKGPRVFMTDNCAELKDAIHQVWPAATTVLCIFHLLQQIWRWLHDKNHGILLKDRPHLLLGFKRAVYAEDEEEFQSEYESLLQDEIAMKYPNFSKYASAVYEDSESWALCYRTELPLRGNNTNNFCEAQFLVIKDEILNRQKEVNVVGLIDKLTTGLEYHYKNKLLAISSGKFDGIYSGRFSGFSKKGQDGIRFKKPATEAQAHALKELVSLGNNTFQMKSFTEEGKSYLVDMTLGVCQCKSGMNGAPCKHQYVLWANKMAHSTNFLPLFSKEQRMEFARIAIGNTMSLHHYEGLHDRVVVMPESNDHGSAHQIENDTQGESNFTAMQHRNVPQEAIAKSECEAALSEVMSAIKSKMDESNQDFLRSILKFAGRSKSMPVSKLTSSFHTFGAAGVTHSRATATSIVKRAKRQKIAVQPEAVKRRKCDSGGRAKQPKGQTVKRNPFQKKAGRVKRPHQFAENVRCNEPMSKKAG
ncbi:uncharacterized protein LOC114526596 [Dendronephthya gigantea]|uniref:uncharacterized protein LOC114526596 n=1 Tax=Dendronephthya gigantea TaxID=151771 RepID=UPI001069D81F|nr:uncharacterized protein LOC114526596 [Dendronephthya gigantea]